MTELLNVAQTVAILLQVDNILLLCHKNPDGDTLGSAAALYHALKAFGKNVAIICADPIPKKYDYMQIELYEQQFEVQYTVSIDVASIQLFGDSISEYTKRINMCIDHHCGNAHYADVALINDKAAATAEIIYAILCSLECDITQTIADCLYTGVATDTGCFMFANTGENTHNVASKLIALGARVGELNRILFQSKSRSRIQIEAMALQGLTYYFDDACAMICLTTQQIEETGVEANELESLTSIARSIEGVKVGITLRQLPSGSYKVSVRTLPGIDAAEICRRLGGGGHAGAAGCEIMGGIENVKSAVLAEVEKHLCKV